MRDWAPDFEVNVETAHAIVARRFPEFERRRPRYLGRGWDNFCITYGDVAFKIPTRSMGGSLVATETAALRSLYGKLPIVIPQVTHEGEPGEDCPYAFFGYKPVPGQSADQASLNPGQAEVLGAFLRELHATSPLEALPNDPMAKADPERQLSKALQRAKAVGMTDVAWLHRLALDAHPSDLRVFVHGDLYARHVMVQSGELSGVIDWGDAHIGHPAVDLACAYTLFGGTELAAFWDAYGGEPAPGDAALARLRAAMLGLALIAYGRDERLQEIITCGSSIVTALREERP